MKEWETSELSDKTLEQVTGGATLPDGNSIDEVEEGDSVWAFDLVNGLYRWGTVNEKFTTYIEVSFGEGYGMRLGSYGKLVANKKYVTQFWLNPMLCPYS